MTNSRFSWSFKFLKLCNIYGMNSISPLNIVIIDILSGKAISVLKIDKDKISRPFVLNENLYIIKENSVIRLN